MVVNDLLQPLDLRSSLRLRVRGERKPSLLKFRDVSDDYRAGRGSVWGAVAVSLAAVSLATVSLAAVS